ncbi:MAG TPA: hypothetical protein VM936_16355 [Pyrinomonadaceae bacterium]|nr:hypothetical protein [Pyrinomonadaceae bacterium]
MDHHRRLDSELDALRDRVLVLGGEAEGTLGRAMYALAERDSAAARARFWRATTTSTISKSR